MDEKMTNMQEEKGGRRSKREGEEEEILGRSKK